MDMDAVHVAGLVSLLARLVRVCVELVAGGRMLCVQPGIKGPLMY